MAVDTEVRICVVCGAPFVPKHEGRTCSRHCQIVLGEQTKRGHPRQEYACRHCGKVFVPKQADRTKYCSRECAFAQWHKESEERKPKSVPIGYCAVCGAAFRRLVPDQVLCGPNCRAEYSRRYTYARDSGRHVPKVYECAECGTPVTTEYGNKRRVFCSKKCAKRFVKRARSAQLRALRHDVRYEKVSALVILERDGWRCRRCGRKTPKRLRGTFDARAPELDHIIPISLGGSHSALNLQCLCRACNLEKSNRAEAQPLLV